MKRWVFLALIVSASAATLYYSEQHKIANRVGPEAVLTAAAEVQKEASHPVTRVVRLSDEEEIELLDATLLHAPIASLTTDFITFLTGISSTLLLFPADTSSLAKDSWRSWRPRTSWPAS